MFSWFSSRAIEKSPQNEMYKVQPLIEAIRPGSRKSTETALKLIDELSNEQLNIPHELDVQLACTTCSLDDDVKHTVVTQCLMYLFDPGRGWDSDSSKRGDMLLMAAKLVEKGGRLEGLFYYRGNPNVHDQEIKQMIQTLINKKNHAPPAMLNDEIVRIFTEAGYHFTYPSEFKKTYASVLRAQSAEVFAQVVFFSDGYLSFFKKANELQNTKRFFEMAMQLPLELQMLLCNTLFKVSSDHILSKDSEPAFKKAISSFN